MAANTVANVIPEEDGSTMDVRAILHITLVVNQLQFQLHIKMDGMRFKLVHPLKELMRKFSAGDMGFN